VLSVLGMWTGTSHLEWLRHGDGSIAIGAATAPPPERMLARAAPVGSRSSPPCAQGLTATWLWPAMAPGTHTLQEIVMSGQTCLRVLPALLSALPLFSIAQHCAGQCTTDWQSIGGLSGEVSAVAEWDPDGPGPLTSRIVVGGSFLSAGGIAALRIAVWDPATGTWSALGAGFNYVVNVLLAMPNGDLFAAGGFTMSGATSTQNIARWDGSSWQPLYSGMPATGINGSVAHMVSLPNGDLVVSGLFNAGGGVALNNIARWDGSAWWPLGPGIPYPGVRDLAVLGNGDVLAASSAGVLRWDGSSWGSFGTGLSGDVTALCALANGDVLAVSAATAYLSLAVCHGGLWTATGASFGGGTPYSFIRDFAPLPDGDVVVAGAFASAGGQAAANIARWDGSAFQPFGIGTDSRVNDLQFSSGGDLLVVGAFTSAGGLPCAQFARLASSCPATVVDLGGGCVGSGGSNTLTAVTRPWVDGTLRTRGTELPSPAIVVADTGLDPIVPGFPLDSVFAEAPAVSCSALLAVIATKLRPASTSNENICW